MKVVLNDATELQVQSVDIESDALKLKFLSAVASQEKLADIFNDPQKTKRIVVQENEKKVAEYENYTKLDGIMVYTGGILEPVLYRNGETTEEKIAKLQEANTALKEQNDMLTQCILEMSELVYQ
ncbi:MAG: hypothetical protein SPL91_05310 [Oliverpabstia intestinalis]|mgnify:CR=1 FL=1|jgi:hypothetical protein|nr:hypothetical protein [Oliverpabstia intestinalis]MDY5790903.1 hypothetical protein [Oliverpabstia intestinalis]